MKSRLAFTRLVLLSTVLVPFCCCFGATLWGDRTLGFRDAANYFFPLFEWQSSEWAAGRIPLWNPHDNCGMPVVGDATSSVFYPGKLLFALPMDFSRRYSLYVSLHVLLAAAAAYALARRFEASRVAAGLCAVSYAFGGNVLFQCCNVVFLVGAAWLPAAYLAADKMVRQHSAKWAVVLGGILAVMVLGGDPQMAYHTVLLIGLYVWLQPRPCRDDSTKDRRGDKLPFLAVRRKPSGAAKPEGLRPTVSFNPVIYFRAAPKQQHVRSNWTLLGVATVTGLLFSAVQVLPAIAWTRTSQRATSEVPRNVYEIGVGQPAVSWTAVRQGLLADPRAGTHHAHIYDYSVGPWRFAELLWPNCYGRPIPENRRWISALPASGRVWTPSLYAGLLPFVLGLSGWSLRASCRRRVWLSWCVLLTAWASLGSYGLGWAIQELRVDLLGAEPEAILCGRPVGGLYWLMVTLLPGYVYFRYPAKLLVIAALGVSLLAAGSWDRCRRNGDRSRCPRLIPLIVCMSLVLGGLSVLCRSVWEQWIERAPVDAIFGPLQKTAAFGDLSCAFVHTSVVAAACWFLLARITRLGPASGYAALWITALDLLVANGWMVQTVANSVWQDPPNVSQRLTALEDDGARIASSRVFRAAPWYWVPPRWAESSSQTRLDEVVIWEHASILPKHHLRAGLSLVESAATLRSRDLAALLRVARQDGLVRPDGRREPNRQVLDALSAEYLLLPAAMEIPGTHEISSEERPLASVKICRNPASYPRAWIVHRWQILPPLEYHAPSRLEQRSREVLGASTRPREKKLRDLRREVVIEGDPVLDAAAVTSGEPAGAEFCRVVQYGPQRVELDVGLATAGYVVMNDSYDGDWQATVLSADAAPTSTTLHRANRVMRAVRLPAGEHRVILRYRPGLFYAGAICSAAAWLALLGGWASLCASSEKRSHGSTRMKH